MGRQINYITAASLSLLLFWGLIYFIDLLPGSQTLSANNDDCCGTENPAPAPALSDQAAKGKTLFMAKCASCHQIFKNTTGPSLLGFEERGPWSDRSKLYEWIKNPAAFMEKDAYTRALYKEYGSMMTGFSDITNNEIDAICTYLNEVDRMRNLPVVTR